MRQYTGILRAAAASTRKENDVTHLNKEETDLHAERALDHKTCSTYANPT